MSNNTDNFLGCSIVGLGFVALLAICLGLVYLFVSGMWYLICLGLGIEFNWFAALAIMAICLLLRWIISAAKPSKN